jgi:hypothetical protein
VAEKPAASISRSTAVFCGSRCCVLPQDSFGQLRFHHAAHGAQFAHHGAHFGGGVIFGGVHGFGHHGADAVHIHRWRHGGGARCGRTGRRGRTRHGGRLRHAHRRVQAGGHRVVVGLGDAGAAGGRGGRFFQVQVRLRRRHRRIGAGAGQRRSIVIGQGENLDHAIPWGRFDKITASGPRASRTLRSASRDVGAVNFLTFIAAPVGRGFTLMVNY